MDNSEQEEAWLQERYIALAKELDVDLVIEPNLGRPGFTASFDVPDFLESILDERLELIIEEVNSR